MSLVYFHHMDGREVGFHVEHVALIEAHESGAGTLVHVGSATHSRELHLAERYDVVKAEIHLTPNERAARAFMASTEAADAEAHPS